MDEGIVAKYLHATNTWRRRLGPTSMVLMQVGSFYEVYALLGSDGRYEGGDVAEFSRINCTRLVPKGQEKDGRSVIMTGFKINYIEEYVQRLVDEGYTVVIISQEYDGPGATRSVSRIVSPGTSIAQGEGRDSNTLYCAWVHRSGANRIRGGQRTLAGAALDVHTGETHVFQVQCEDRHDPAVYDELERQVAVHRPSECIIVQNLAEEGRDLATYMGYCGSKLHLISETEDSELGRRASNAAKQTYQDEALTRYYGTKGRDQVVADMAEDHDLGLQALVFLLDFAHMHNAGLTERLTAPSLSTRPGRLNLKLEF